MDIHPGEIEVSYPPCIYSISQSASVKTLSRSKVLAGGRMTMSLGAAGAIVHVRNFVVGVLASMVGIWLASVYRCMTDVSDSMLLFFFFDVFVD